MNLISSECFARLGIPSRLRSHTPSSGDSVRLCSCSCGAACRALTCSSLWGRPPATAADRHQPRQQFEIICLFSFMEYFVCHAAFKSLKHKLRERNNRAEQWSGVGGGVMRSRLLDARTHVLYSSERKGRGRRRGNTGSSVLPVRRSLCPSAVLSSHTPCFRFLQPVTT